MDKNMDGYIYKVTSEKNNMCYVGETFQFPTKRWKHHIHYAKNGSNVKFHKALREQEWFNFTWEIIEVIKNATKEKLVEREKFWISYYDSYSNGYNSNTGGNAPPRTDIPIICLETNTIYKSSREASEQTGISAVHIAECARNAKKRAKAGGYHWMHVDDYLEKGAVYRKLGNELNSKSVICVETGVIYPSILSASKATGISRTIIKKIADGKLKRETKATKYHWQYYKNE